MKFNNAAIKGLLILACFTITFSCENEPVEEIFITDTDGDSINDDQDNCPETPNEDQLDTDGDGLGDECDTDDDDDGILDIDDNCPLIANSEQEDIDNDGLGDACDDFINVEPTFPCEDGMAGPYPCNGYDLMSQLSIEDLGGPGADGNDSWGWTDPVTGVEYALVGTTSGAAFVDISDPTQPVIVGKLSAETNNSPWRDIKVYNDHAFIVSEAAWHGMQVFDLSRLRDVTSPPETFTADALYTGFGSAHNIYINEDSGYAYAIGTSTFDGGPHFVNIQDPLNPVAAGGYADNSYSHDVQVINYNGPDGDYSGREVLIGSNENEVVIVDVTDKANPVTVSTISYNNIGYTHQGWFTEDLRFFIVGDEVDELSFGFNTRTLVFDLSDLDNPVFHMDYSGPTAAIDHNGYVLGNTFYLSNYTAGLRVIDVTNIGGREMTEIGFFDTFPANDNTSFNGAWNVYPFFASGNIIISDINGGLFIVRKSE